MSAFDRFAMEVDLVHETDKAILVRYEGREEWLPRRCLVEFKPLPERRAAIVISMVVAREKGFFVLRFSATDSWWISERAQVWVGRQPIDGDIRNEEVAVYRGVERVAAGIVIAAGGFGQSGPQVRMGDTIGIVVR